MGQPSPEAKQAWLERNKHKRPEINRNWKLRRVYGITPQQYEEMYKDQQGKCGICGNPFSSNKDTHIDHDHNTKWVRGLLCGNCNVGIGNFYDDILRLQSAIRYLTLNVTPPEFVFIPVPNDPELKKHSDNRKLAQSFRAKGNTFAAGHAAWNKGKPWSEETKEKMRKPKCRKTQGN